MSDSTTEQGTAAPPAAKPTRTPPRVPPPPWLDCEHCGWRHYPSGRRGQMWTTQQLCSSCGKPLPERE